MSFIMTQCCHAPCSAPRRPAVPCSKTNRCRHHTVSSSRVVLGEGVQHLYEPYTRDSISAGHGAQLHTTNSGSTMGKVSSIGIEDNSKGQRKETQGSHLAQQQSECSVLFLLADTYISGHKSFYRT